jgi:hypothetical protein
MRDFLQSHVGPESPLLLGFNPITDSPFIPRDWKRTINFTVDRRDINADNAPAFSAEQNFKMPKVAEKVGKLQLVYTISALTNGGAGTYERLVDFAGFEAIDRIEISYAGNHLQTIYGLQLYLWHRMHLRQDKQDAQAHLVGGNLTAAERNTAADAAQTFYVDIPAFFTYETHQSFPPLVLADELRIDVHFKSLNSIVQSDSAVGTVTATITSSKLRVTFINLIQMEREVIKQGTQEGNGLIFPILDVERQSSYQLASGSATHQVKLTNPKSPCSYFLFVVRNNADINTPYANNPFNFQAIDSWNMEANNQPLVRDVEHEYQMYYLNPLYTDATPRDNVYGHYFSLAPENRVDHHGSNYFAMQNNPVINVTHTGALATNHYFDGLFFVHNFIQIKGPDIVKIFK